MSWIPPTKEEVFRDKLRRQMSNDEVFYRHLNIVKPCDPEYKARGLLREMIGDHAFRDYLKKGFITVKGKSGLVYKIMRGCGSGAIASYAPTPSGKYRKFESICVVFKDSRLPPTDSVIMRMLLCQRDEFGLRSMANVSRVCSPEEVSFEARDDLIEAARRVA